MYNGSLSYAAADADAASSSGTSATGTPFSLAGVEKPVEKKRKRIVRFSVLESRAWRVTKVALKTASLPPRKAGLQVSLIHLVNIHGHQIRKMVFFKMEVILDRRLFRDAKKKKKKRGSHSSLRLLFKLDGSEIIAKCKRFWSHEVTSNI